LKGSIVISAPLIFQKSKTLEIFDTIGMNTELIIFSSDLLVIIFILLSILSSFIIVSSVRNLYALVLVLDLMAILVLNYFLQPLLAFTLYFCFLHSIRHSISLMYELDNNLTKSIPIFFKKSLPLTLLTGFLFVTIFILLMGEFDVSNSINKVIFIGLAALTLPHITLEYILEKKAEI
jgi:Brp/Blh family beta-carotene 15,15'-monooxygenase